MNFMCNFSNLYLCKTHLFKLAFVTFYVVMFLTRLCSIKCFIDIFSLNYYVHLSFYLLFNIYRLNYHVLLIIFA